MALFRTGLGGLAYVHNFGEQEGRELELQKYQRQQRIDAETQAKLLADDFDVQKVSNPYDQAKLTAYSENLIHGFGQYSRANPNWAMTPEGQMKRVSTRRELLNNDWVLRDQRYKANKQMESEALKRNPDIVNTPEWQRLRQEDDNYRRYGSADGIEGGGKEYIFKEPNTKDVLGDIQDIGKKMGTVDTLVDINGNSFMRKAVPDESITLMAHGILQTPRGRQIESIFNNLDPREKDFYKTPQKYLETRLKIAGNIEYDSVKLGNAVGARNAATARLESSYYQDVMGQPANSKLYSAHTDAVSPVVNGVFTPNKEGLKFAFQDTDGKFTWNQLDSFNGQRFDGVETSKEIVKGPSGETYVALKLKDVPINEELTRKYPIIEDGAVSKKYSPYVSIKMDKNGKPTDKMDLTVFVRAIENENSVAEYEKKARGLDFANAHHNDAFKIKQQQLLNSDAPGTVRLASDGTRYQKQNDGNWAQIVR